MSKTGKADSVGDATIGEQAGTQSASGWLSGWLRRNERSLIYFGSVIGLIVLVNAPVLSTVLVALLGNEIGGGLATAGAGITRDLFLLLLVSIYFEWVRGRQNDLRFRSIEASQMAVRSLLHENRCAIERSVTDGQASMETAISDLDKSMKEVQAKSLEYRIHAETSPAQLLKWGLHRVFGTRQGLEDLVGRFRQDQDIQYEVSVAVRAARIQGDLVHIEHTVNCQVDADEILIATVRTSTKAAALIASSKNLFETLSIPEAADKPPRTVDVREKFTLYVRDRGGLYPVLYDEVPDEEKASLLNLPTGVDIGDVKLLRADLRNYSERKALKYTYRYSVKLESNQVFWTVDRPSFVRTVQFDLSALVNDTRHVAFQLFFPAASDAALASGGMINLDLNCWMLPGNGLSATWATRRLKRQRNPAAPRHGYA